MIFSAFERMLAFRYLRARRKEGFVSVIAGFSVLGIMLGVATLIIVMSVMSGFRVEFMNQILGLNGHIGVYGPGMSEALTEYDPLVAKIRGIDGVTGAFPTIESQVLITANDQALGAMVRGMRADDLFSRKPITRYYEGEQADFTGEDVVVIGYRLANRLRVGLGEKVTLILPSKATNTAFGSVPRMKTYTVVGVFDAGMYQYDNGYLFMPLEGAQLFFKYPNAVTHIEVTLSNPDNVRAAMDAIYTIAPMARLYNWQNSNSGYMHAVKVQSDVMFLILTLIIIVAAFNIISSLIMLVKDKGRDVAILRTMGATRGMIMRIFFLTGASIGVAGTLIGVGLGVIITLNLETIRQFLEAQTGSNLFDATVYGLSTLPAILNPWEVLTVALMSLGLSFAATFYPSWRAARLDPVEALRYE